MSATRLPNRKKHNDNNNNKESDYKEAEQMQ